MPADAHRPLEDIYELAPLQAGMLFHQLSAPGSGWYCEQMSFELAGELDEDAFARAWQAVVARHPALRTSFQWEGLDQALQVVQTSAIVPIEHRDWTADGGASPERLERLAVSERERGFDLGRAPLMRVAMVRTAPARRHVLWTHSHLLLDGWCLPLLLRELTAAYAAFASGASPALSAPRPYRDFIAWLRTRDPAAGRAFWAETLRGFAEPTPLPVVRTPAASGGDGVPGEILLSFSAEETSRLADSCRRERITLSTLCQGAWALVLARLTGRTDIVFGTTVSGRPAELAGVEGMIGLFINTLPARAILPAEAAPADWLRALQAAQAAARAHEHTPLVQILEGSEVPRNTELFATLFAFENYPAAPPADAAPGGLRVTGVQARERTHYALTVAAARVDERLSARLLYDGGRVARPAAEAIAARFESAIRALAAGGGRLGDLDLLTAAERRDLLAAGRGAGKPRTPSARPVPAAVLERARLAPQAVALREAGRITTYGELAARAQSLAVVLRSHGVGPEAVAAVCLPRSAELVTAQLAIWLAGGAYLPLDPAHPPERLRDLAADARARVIVTDAAGRASFAGSPVPLVDPAAASSASPLAAGPADPGQLAYVIYTSGSSGQPKGVAVSQGSLAHLADWHAGEFGLTSTDTVTMLAGQAFDASVWEIWPALAAGAAVAVAPPSAVADPAILRDWLVAERISLSFVPTPLAELLLRLPWPETPALRWMLTGGDRLGSAPPAGLPFRLSNNYGPTEHTVVATSGPVPSGANARPPDLGRPIGRSRLYLVGRDFGLVPMGASGEIALGGESLARGYLGRPDLTAAAFVPDPFSGESGARLYCTGDLARWNEEGRLEFQGRADQQVKIRGVRIELGEVEAALAALPGVVQAVAEVRRLGETAALVAWLVAGPGLPPDEAAARARLRERLPAAMLPAHWVWLKRLPLTSNGKVDRRALPAPDWAAFAAGEPPATLLEEAIAGIWADALGRPRVGVKQNFFDAGGHSLLLMKVQDRVQAHLGRPVPMLDFFTYPTVRTLAAHLALGAAAATPAAEAPAAAARAEAQREALQRRRLARTAETARS
jgi:amino acid adenylation domain-containing protein